jgi:hypothetical protein
MNMNIVHVGKGITDCQNDSVGKQALPFANPPCEMELTDADLEGIYGGGFVGGLLGNLLGRLSLGGKRPETASSRNHMGLEGESN